MRYQWVADNPTEENALKSHPTARVLFDPFLPVIQARAIMAAVRLGIFETLGSETRSIDRLAADLSLDANTLGLLMPVLACAGYVCGDKESYCLTEPARATLLAKSPLSLTGWVEHNYLHWKAIARLEDVLQSGQGVGLQQSMSNQREWAICQQAMLETARPAADWVASQILIRAGARTMLDIGGSHGLYGATMCRRHPPMKSVVLELAQAIDPARELAKQEGIDDVVTHRAGDVMIEDLGHRTFDAVFLGNIIHHFTEVQNRDLFQRIKIALKTEGTIAIWDFQRPAPEAPRDLVGDGLALFFRITSAARCYTPSELINWLKTAGFADLVIHPTPMPAQMLITARAK